jgi:D-alanine-D-alanine ligase
MDTDDDLQIGLVFNQEEATVRGDPKDLIAIGDTATTADHLYKAIKQLGYRVAKIPARKSLENFRKELGKHSPSNTFIFNNCDGFNGINSGSVDVTRIIEELGFKHTGSTPEAISLCTDKVRCKQKLIDMGVPTPPYQVFLKAEGTVNLHFPLIVKPAYEDGSMGIDFNSVTKRPKALMDRVAYVLEKYEQPALVEEFIAGRELNVAVWGNSEPEALPVDEEDYSRVIDPLKRFLTYEAKWYPDSYYYQNILPLCPADLAPLEAHYVQTVAINAFKAIGLRDFGRIDMRYHNQIAYVVDVNDIPDLSPTSGFPRTARAGGYDYKQMVEHLIQVALKREEWK